MSEAVQKEESNGSPEEIQKQKLQLYLIKKDNSYCDLQVVQRKRS